MLLLQAPNHTARGGESINLSQMLSQKKLTPTLDPNPIRRWYKGPKYFLQDNWKRFWVLALWIGIMAGLFTYKIHTIQEQSCLWGDGTLCFNGQRGSWDTQVEHGSLGLLPICRNTITWLKNKTRLGVTVPFDDNLNFHKGSIISISLIHSFTLIHFYSLLVWVKEVPTEFMKKPKKPHRLRTLVLILLAVT